MAVSEIKQSAKFSKYKNMTTKEKLIQAYNEELLLLNKYIANIELGHDIGLSHLETFKRREHVLNSILKLEQ